MKQTITIKQISLVGIFSALCVVGSLIRVPAIIGSVAFDSTPALVLAILGNSLSSAFVGGIGHLLSALLAGMPLGPLHFMIAIIMSIITYLFAIIHRKSNRFAVLFFIIGNGILAPIPFLFIMGIEFYLAILTPLLIASTLNVIVAELVCKKFKKFNLKTERVIENE